MANNKKYVGDVDSGLDVTNMYNTNASLDTSTGDNTLKTNYGSSGMQTYPIRTLLPSQDEIDIRKGIAKERGHTAQVSRLEYREKKMKYNQEKRAGKFEERQENKLAKLKSREAAGKLRSPGKDRIDRLEDMGYGSEGDGANMMSIDRALNRAKRYSSGPKKMRRD
jgi:hypothetical protein